MSKTHGDGHLTRTEEGLDIQKHFYLVLMDLMILLLKKCVVALSIKTIRECQTILNNTSQYEGMFLTVMLWEDKRDTYILNAPSEEDVAWMNTTTPSSQT
jgi:hypothetical protein